jgi:hypothetical protein
MALKNVPAELEWMQKVHPDATPAMGPKELRRQRREVSNPDTGKSEWLACAIVHGKVSAAGQSPRVSARMGAHASNRSTEPSTRPFDLLEIIMRRYERFGTLLTSNRPVEDWGKLLGNVAAVSAMLDRLLHYGHVLKCGPRSWRTKTATVAG